MATADDERRSKELTPFLNLSLPEVATSLCFVGVGGRGSQSLQSSYRIETNLDGNDSDSSDELTFRTSSFAKKSTLALQYQQRQELLHERLLMTCHPSGQVRIWNCLQQKCISGIDSRGGAGMAVKRLYDPSLFLYQTRDPNGVVSVHSLARSGASSIVRKYETHSATFCQAAPCEGDSHLLALPSSQETVAAVMDGRVREPIFSTSPLTDHGMVTSLALSISGTANRPILACGMESGSVYFYDFGSGKIISQGDVKLTKDPILALDMVPAASSFEEKGDESSSVLAAAGMAGDAVEVADMPTWEQGRVALIKASTNNSKISSEWNIRTRARLSTCKIDNESSGGKPGVSICRFRPGDGRLVAVGGWDNRVRLFERTRGKPLAILRGHEGSVNALDWAHDAANSGLLATAGANDSTVSFWRCFGKK